MSSLFDASALLNLIRALGPDSFDHFKGGYILTLTPYEVGNALWKEAALLNKISMEEALSSLKRIDKVYRILNQVFPKDVSSVMKVAHELKITYYDASYIVAAHELDVKLVTDDEALRKRARMKRLVEILGGEVSTCSSMELIGR